MTETLDAALRYAKLGLRIIPIAPGEKYPKGIPNWQTDATNNPATIQKWFTDKHKNWGIGIATGQLKPGTHLFVLDIDEHNPNLSGNETLHQLEQDHTPLPDTCTVHTPTGGRHLYFLSPTEILNNTASRLGPGLDIRGTGGQVLAPPTLHPNGKPYIENVEHGFNTRPAQAPQWLLNLLTYTPPHIDPHKPATPHELANTTPSDIYNNQTNWPDLLTNDGWTYAYRDKQNIDYWTRPGKTTGISATVGHGGGDHLIIFTTNAPIPQGGYSRFGYYAASKHNGNWKQAAKTIHNKPQPATPTTPDTTPNDMLNMLVNWQSFWDLEYTVEDWLAKPLIAKNRQTALYAEAKQGKSWLTLSVAAALATGKPILGQPAQPPVHILYLDYEMTQADLYERLEQFGYTEQDNLSHLHYAIIPTLAPLNTPEGADELMRLVHLTQAQAVVIDTTGRAIEGEENSADSYREFARTTGLALKKAGIALIRTDHAGKKAGQGQRGSSAKNDDVDIVYRLTRTTTGITLERTHTRINWVPATVELVVDDIDDITTIRLKTQPKTGWTTNEIEWARKLENLHIDPNLGVNAVIKHAQENNIKLCRKTTLIRAIACRKTQRPDPLEPSARRTDSNLF